MATTRTTNKGLEKPEVNGSIDQWGSILNGGLDKVDGWFELGGGLRLSEGGTGATTAAAARINLGLGNTGAARTGLGLGAEDTPTFAGATLLYHNPNGGDSTGSLRVINSSGLAGTLSGLALHTGDGLNTLLVARRGADFKGEMSLLLNTGGAANAMGEVLRATPTSLISHQRLAFSRRLPTASDMDVGYRGAPARGVSGTYILAADDAGGSLQYGEGGVVTIVIPGDPGGGLPAGTVVVLVCLGGTMNVTAPASVTLAWCGTNLTGARTLNAFGLASLYKVHAGLWAISGAGLS
jgi:hypothetical protein